MKKSIIEALIKALNTQETTIFNLEAWKECVRTNNKSDYNAAVVITAHNLIKHINTNGLPTKEGHYPDLSTPHGYMVVCQPWEYGISGAQAMYVIQLLKMHYELGELFYEMYMSNRSMQI